MVIKEQHIRNRVVKGWAFMDLPEDEDEAIRKFLETGNTDDLPVKFQRPDYTIYYGRA